MAKKKRHPLALAPEQVTSRCPAAHFSFKTTADLPTAREIIGQPRGVRSIEFGIDMFSPGYNIYVMGQRGTGRLTAIERFIKARASDAPVPDDVLYVHNFKETHQPVALTLPAGKGAQFVEDMKNLVAHLQTEITRVFESQQFNEKAQALKRSFQEKRDQLFQQVQSVASEKGFVIRSTSSGMMLAPLKDDQVMTSEVYEALTDEERSAIESRRQELEAQVEESMRQAAELEEVAREAYKKLVKDEATTILDEQFSPLQESYADFQAVLTHLEQMREDVLNHVEDFVGEHKDDSAEDSDEAPSLKEALLSGITGRVGGLRRYAVNLLVEHPDAQGAPVVVVDLPTYQNLIGRIEYRMRYGALTTDFTMIKSGALHRANGGYLVIRALDILSQPFAWEALKRALNTGQICIEEPESRGTSVITTQMLAPAPIPLRVKVIMLGSPFLYYTLFENEEDFPELFKVRADFAGTMDYNAEAEAQYATFIATRCHEEQLPHFSAAAVARVVDYGIRLAADQNKISTRFGEVTDLIREAAYYARHAGHDTTEPEDVHRAVEERRYRSNLYEELSHRDILEGDIIVETDGEAVGQINGLTVIPLGDYIFGQPTRITARVYVGQTDVVQIEREVRMTGPIHDKGVLILRGYLGSMYAQDFPLSLAASLTFEQNYGGVEGDSASSTELFALLSALSGLPIRQDLAVTGSVDQRGVIQPIGGVTEKIEGFFNICHARGLTGSQGVLIPQANARNLTLDDTVTEAVRRGEFHIYAIRTIDEGVELLMGLPAGQRQPDGSYPPGTVHHAVQERLRALAQSLRGFTAPIVNVG